MLPPKRILFPVDYSEPCRSVIPYVKDAIAHFGAELTLVHAYGPGSLAYSDLALADPNLPEDVRRKEEQHLRSFALQSFPGAQAQVVVANGDAGAVVDQVVKTMGTDLVMLATHGHGPVRRFLLGSVSAKILHDLDCAVWTATAAALESRSAGVKFVLSALDGGDTDETVARAGAALAASYGAQLALVHVVEPPIPAVEMDYAIIRKELLDAADQRLREIKGTLGLDAAHAVLEGGVALRIRDEAVHRKADVIVTGRGRDQGVLSRFWSHLYSIVRDAPCPVLSI